jgi:hypothetical protein
MSNETSSVILSICGIAVVVGVLIILAGFLVVRILKSSIFGLGMMALKVVNDPKEEPPSESLRSQSAARPKRDLRAQAQSVDFDSAVARHAGKRGTQSTPTTPPPSNPFSAQSAPPLRGTSTGEYPSLKPRRPQRRKTDEGEDMDFMESLGDDD